MRYVLDGIKTAMEKETQIGEWWALKCACGEEWEGTGGPKEMKLSARFHYTHCGQAHQPGDTTA